MKLTFLALLLSCASPLFAQSRKPSKPLSPSSPILTSAKATGSTRYTSEQIVAATGLQKGKAVSEDDFKIVTQQLGETGAFSNVAYTFQFSSEGMKLELQLTDSDRFVPARFENFVWLSEKELLEKLQASVPLFQGQLPVTGKLIDDVSDVLQTLAIEHKLKGRVDYLREGPADGPIEAFDFSITGEDIRIRQIEFPGAGSAELPALQSAAKNLGGEEYARTALRVQAEKNFLPIYRERGYLNAALSDPQPKVVSESPDETVVDVSFPVTPGLQYKLSELQVSGDKVFPAEKLRQLIHLHPGEFVNAVQLNKDVDGIKRLYGSRGYMATRIEATPELNDAESTAKYALQIQEGDIYKMGDLDIRGLDSRATERMAAAWNLREGNIYNSQYPKDFTRSAISLLPGEDEWDIVVHETVEEKDKTVDVSLHFEHKR